MSFFTRQGQRRALRLAVTAGAVAILGLACSSGQGAGGAPVWDCGPESNPGSVKATLKGGTLVISGRGDMANYAYSANGKVVNSPWYGHSLSITKVVIENGVTSIGQSAFLDYPNLVSVTIGGAVTAIGKDAFDKCVKLASVTIPADMTETEIDALEDAFDHCSTLKAINVAPGNAKYSSVDGVVFNKDRTTLILCPEGKTGAYAIPDGVASVHNLAFQYCVGLTSVTIPNGVTSIGRGAFNGCTGLAAITIPNSVASIGRAAFGGTGLTSVTIPSGVTSLGSYAFINCAALKSVTVAEGVTSIGDTAFAVCNGLTSVTIPGSVTSIGSMAFAACSSLASITIPGGVTSIGHEAFLNCVGLTTVTFGESLKTIGKRAFNGCAGLSEVIVPENITAITWPGWREQAYWGEGEWRWHDVFAGGGKLSPETQDRLRKLGYKGKF